MHAPGQCFRRASPIIATALLLSACAPGAHPMHPGPRAVFVIVMENHSPAQALAGPFLASMAARYRVAANYQAVTHPSAPNYLALTSGQTWGLHEDAYRILPQADLGSQLTAAGIPWRAYMEGLTNAGCNDSPLPYRRDHNPFAYYGGACPENVVPFSALDKDLAQVGGPRFSWITPDDCHNTHDCPVSVGDEWLRTTVTRIMASDAWKTNGIIFITWDEDDGSVRNRVLTLAISPDAGHHVSFQPYNHYSLLATIEDLMSVSRLGAAQGAASMQDLVSP